MSKTQTLNSQQQAMYERFSAIYGCGCIYTNDSWAKEDECDRVCPNHKKALEMTTIDMAIGIRPENCESELSSMRVPLETLRRMKP